MNRRSRRAILGGLAGLGTVLAGCSSRGTDDETTNDGADVDPSGPFASIRVEGTALVVELAEGSSVDGVNVIAPSGAVFAEQRVATGATRVEIGLDTRYRPGEHRILAVRDGESVAETTLAIRPDLEILDVSVGANNLDEIPEGLNFREEQALVTVRNRGNGPARVSRLLLLGDLPNPTSELETGDSDTEDGLYSSGEPTDSGVVTIPANERDSLVTDTMPFLFSGDGVECRPESQQGEFTITIELARTDSQASAEFNIQYSASQTSDGCSIEIGGEVSV